MCVHHPSPRTPLILHSSDTYLQTNDQINSVLERYEAFKRGETPPASIPAEFLPGENESLSLIDLDDGPSQPGSSNGAGSSSKATDDLASLFGSASLTSGPTTSPLVAAPTTGLGFSSLVPNVSQPTSAISPQISSPLPGTSRPQPQFGQIKLPTTPPIQNQLQAAGRIGSPNVGSSLGPTRVSPSNNPVSGTFQQTLVSQATSPPTSQASTLQGKDPFADLAGLF
jgi:hypothetical protein